MRNHRRTARLSACVAFTIVVASLVAGCGESARPDRHETVAAQDGAVFRILPDPAFGARSVTPMRPVGLTVTGGELRVVRLTNADGERVAGRLSDDKRRWTATEPLAFGMLYTWRGSAVDAAGERYPISGTFQTLQPEQLVNTTANVADGGVYPVDLQIAVTFSAPVENRRAAERALMLTTSPSTRGDWTWSASNTVATWQPARSWRPDTRVQLSGKLYGVPLGDGHYGARDMHFGFRIVAG